VLVPGAREQAIFAVVPKRRIRRDTLRRQADVVPVNAVNHPVRSERKLVPSVTNATRRGFEQSHFIKLIVAVRIPQTVEALRVVGVRVK
jgi:hypothetical protein